MTDAPRRQPESPATKSGDDDAPSAVILAAGRGRRMGGPKALARWAGTPFVLLVARTFREAGCPAVVVVAGAGADEVQAVLRGLDGVTVVRVPDPSAPMLASVRAGAAAAPGAEERGVLFHPVDAPRVTAAAIRRLLASATAREPGTVDAVVAACGGRRGHPLWVAPARAAELRDVPPDHPDGLRGWMRDRRWRVESAETDDAFVLDDFDTKEELDHVR